MKKLFEAFLQKLREMREQANKNLAGLQPLEQNEAASQMKWFFDGCRYTAERLGSLASDAEKLFGDVETEYASALKTGIEEAKKDAGFLKEIAEMLTKDGTLVTKATADSMVETAKEKAEGEVKTKLQNEAAELKKADERRTEFVKEVAEMLKPKLGDKAATVATEVASTIGADTLKGEGWAGSSKVISGRLKEIVALGVTGTKALQTAAGIAPDKEDEFKSHKGMLQEVASSGSSSGGGGSSSARRAPLAGSGNERATEENPGEQKPARKIIC